MTPRNSNDPNKAWVPYCRPCDIEDRGFLMWNGQGAAELYQRLKCTNCGLPKTPKFVELEPIDA